METATWQGLQGGSDEAKARLWDEVQAACAPYLRWRGVHDAVELDELLHEVFQTACLCARNASFDEPKNLRGFLKGRARGVFSIWANHKRKERQVDHRSPLETYQGQELDPSEHAERRDTALSTLRAILECRNRLDAERYRPVWSLRYEAQVDLEQIANRLGRNYETVVTQVFRANSMMRDCLRARGISP